jgi:hypothetical protein
LNLKVLVHDISVDSSAPAIAPMTTTTIGGARHAVNSTKPTMATLTSDELWMELVHTG